MNREIMEIAGKTCVVYVNNGGGPVLYWGVSQEDRQETDQTVHLIKDLLPQYKWTLAAFETEDWNASFSPWNAPAVFRNQAFSGMGAETLRWLTDYCVPTIESAYPTDSMQRMIGGYSLAGLFALWAFYESGSFCGAAACSASLWYPGWDAYVRTKSVPHDSLIYLSLGEKEEKTKNPTMALVGERMRWQYDLLSRDPSVRDTALVWHPGGHFTDVPTRIAQGFAWLLERTAGKI